MKYTFVARPGEIIKFELDLKDRDIQILKINANVPRTIGYVIDGKVYMNEEYKSKVVYSAGIFYLKDIRLEDLGRYVFCGLGLEIDLQIKCVVRF